MNYRKLETPQGVTLIPQSAAQASVVWLHGLGADGNDFVPIAMVCNQRRQVDLHGELWSSVLAATGQPPRFGGQLHTQIKSDTEVPSSCK